MGHPICRAGEELSYQLNWILGGGKADALRRHGAAGKECARAETVVAADEGVEALERKCEVGAALVVGDGVDFVDDDGADVAEMFAGFAGGEQQVERLGRGDEDVRRVAQHARALQRERIAGADGGADGRAEVAASRSQLLNFGERAVEVFLHVVREGFERGDVDDLRGGRERAGNGQAQELVYGDEKGGQRFAGAGGRGDERGFAAQDGGPALLLRFGGGAEFGEEPLGHDGVRPGKGVFRVRIGLQVWLQVWIQIWDGNGGHGVL